MAVTKTKTIVIVFNSLNIGGIETKIMDICDYYSCQKNYQVFLLLKIKTGPLINKIPDNIKLISFLKFNHHKLQNLLFPFWLSKQFHKINPCLIITFGNFSSISGVIANKINRIHANLIISEDSSIDQQISQESFSTIRRFLIKKTYPLAQKIIVLSPTGKDKLVNLIPIAKSQIVVRKNWLPLRYTKQLSKKPIKKDIDILFMARLENQKNPLRFLKIIKKITETQNGLKIFLVGSGSMESDIKNYIINNHLHNKIIVKSATDKPYAYYQRSKIFLISSNHEGFPLTILESIAADCLPVYYNLPEISHFFNHNKSIEYNSLKEASKKTLYLLKNPKKLKKILNTYKSKILASQKKDFNQTINEFQKYS